MNRIFANHTRSWICGLVALVAALFYFPFLPHTVQTGDTGELVTNAYLLGVPHPPGYPLYIWLNHLWLKLVPWGSVFFRAALLQALFMAAGLGFLAAILFRNQGKQKGVFLGLGFCLAFVGTTSPLFWEYAILPDVFALHLFLAALIVYTFTRAEAGPKWAGPLVFIFFLGIANHHTIIFLSPLVGFAIWRARKQRAVWLWAAGGLLACLALYLSLLGMRVEARSSWGNLQGLPELLHHFLRKDYGTFQLSAGDDRASPLYLWKEFAKHAGVALWPALLALAVAWSGRAKGARFRRNEIAVIGCLFFYMLVFFSLANIVPTVHSAKILERFLLLPLWLLLLLTAVVAGQVPALPKRTTFLLLLACVSGALTNFFLHHCDFRYARNTIVEDYTVNLLRQTAGRDAILLTINDTGYGALMYAQEVLGVEPRTLVVAPSLLGTRWYRERLHKLNPRFRMRETGSEDVNLWDDVVEPNLDNFAVHASKHYTWAREAYLTVLPLGLRLERGQGYAFIAFDESARSRFQFRSRPDVVPGGPEFNQFRYIFAEYAHFYLRRGLSSYSGGDLRAAERDFTAALELVPYALPALRNLCVVLQKIEPKHAPACLEAAEQMTKASYDYFPDKGSRRRTHDH